MNYSFSDIKLIFCSVIIFSKYNYAKTKNPCFRKGFVYLSIYYFTSSNCASSTVSFLVSPVGWEPPAAPLISGCAAPPSACAL